MVVTFVFTYRIVRRSESSNASVRHTQQVLSALVAVEGAAGGLVFAATDQAIDQALAELTTHVDELAQLTVDNAQQQIRLVELRALLPDIVRERRIAMRDGSASMSHALVPERLSQVMHSIREEELRLLTLRVEEDTRAADGVRMVVFAVTGGSGVLLVWVFGLVLRDERYRRQNEAALRRANEDLDRRVVARTAELNAAVEREHSLRRQAENSNRLKDEFLMTVSHELRTPLNALLGWADMLRMGVVPVDRRQRALESVYENAKLQKQLIADLLDTARILTGKLRIDIKPVDLARVIRDAAEVVEPTAQAKGLTLDVTIDPDLGDFVGDAARLQQVIWNLVANAVKFTRAGTVSIAATRDQAERQVCIVVADTGEGISDDFLPHVFDRFRQEKTGTTRPHGGLGLGLAIARELVELHGGTISVENRPDSPGAVFTVILPIAEHLRRDVESSEPIEAIAKPNDMPTLTGVRVLVVDDDAGAREMVAATLNYCGADVMTAASAVEARASLAERKSDVLLIDIAMPGEDGYALIRDLRANGLRQPAVALTAQTRDVDRARALEEGFTAHVAKPVEAHTIARTVASLVADAPIAAR